MSGGGALSADGMHRWFQGASPAILDQRLSAVFGRGPRLDGDGATWVSLSGDFGHGRLVRAADGSSTTTARRNHDGVRLLDEHHDTTTTAQLDGLVRALRGGPST